MTPEILSKVRKLLALGSSPSEAEAASALEKARVLLARYGLTVEDVDPRDSEVQEGLLLEKKRLRAWESHLIHVVSQCTFTQALHVQRAGIGQVLLIGREVNIQAARDLFTYLHRVVLILGRAHSQQVAHLESFKRGLVHRVGERLSALSAGKEEKGGPWQGSDGSESSQTKAEPEQQSFPSGPASDRQLILQMTAATTRENQEFISEKYGKTKTKRTGSRVEASSYYRGREAGEGVSLNRQIK